MEGSLSRVLIRPWMNKPWEPHKLNCSGIDNDPTGNITDVSAARVIEALQSEGVKAAPFVGHIHSGSSSSAGRRDLQDLSTGELIQWMVVTGHSIAVKGVLARKHDGKSMAWLRSPPAPKIFEEEFGLVGGAASRLMFGLEKY